MKIAVNDVEICDIGQNQKDLFGEFIPQAQMEDAVAESIGKLLLHKYEQCMLRLRREWEPKLAAQDIDIPQDDDEFATLVFAHPDYKDKSARMRAQNENFDTEVIQTRDQMTNMMNSHKQNLQGQKNPLMNGDIPV
jgi:hypothetical protein